MRSIMDSTETKVTITFRTDKSADEIVRLVGYDDGLFAGSPESVIITETHRVRLENKPMKSLDSAA